MLGSGDRFEQQVKDRPQMLRRRNLFAEIVVGLEELECGDACALDFVEVFDDEIWRGEFFG